MFLFLVLVTAATMAQEVPAALHRMVETERAFARRARETTVREAFIEFFADESVAFEPDPVAARESLRKRSTPQPPGFQLLWEPRFGDVAASGDLGYLTGPAEYILPGQPTRYTNYFSVWKRQPSGEYRVILDVGVATPEKSDFAPGFVRAQSVGTWKGSETRAVSENSLMNADTQLAARIAKEGTRAYASVMHAEVRFMRPNFQPMTTRDAALAWLASHAKELSTEPLKAETATSGDFGYTWGRYRVTPPKAESVAAVYYIRVWTRKSDGAWQLAAEVITSPPPERR